MKYKATGVWNYMLGVTQYLVKSSQPSNSFLHILVSSGGANEANMVRNVFE